MVDPHKGARDVFDSIKAIKLNDSGSVWVGFGGQARGRLARQSTVTFGGPGDFEPTMWTWRFRGYGDIHFGKHFRAYAEGIYSHTSINESRLGPTTAHANLNGDVLNAFGEFKGNVSRDSNSACGVAVVSSSSATNGWCHPATGC